jgi:hypothetical protein
MAQAKTLGNRDALRRQVASDQFANTELSNFPSTACVTSGYGSII